MDNTKLNNLAIETLKKIEQQGYFKQIIKIEEEFNINQTMSNKVFYAKHQDRLIKVSGALKENLSKLEALLKVYTDVRKTEMLENRKCIETNGRVIQLSREPGDSLLISFAHSEITDLIKVVAELKAWENRIMDIVQTCRSHIGSNGVNNGKKNI